MSFCNVTWFEGEEGYAFQVSTQWSLYILGVKNSRRRIEKLGFFKKFEFFAQEWEASQPKVHI